MKSIYDLREENKVRKVAGVLLILVLLLSSCIRLEDESDPVILEEKILHLKYSFIPSREEVLETYIDRPFFSASYRKIEDLHTELINETVSDVEVLYPSKPLVKSVDDGFIVAASKGLATSFRPTGISSHSNVKIPFLYKIDLEGNLVWEKMIDYGFFGDDVTNLVILDDGRIMFCLPDCFNINKDEPINRESVLVMCNADGDELWHKGFEDEIGHRFEKIFLSEDNSILAVGEKKGSNKEIAYYTDNDIIVTKIDTQGKIIKESIFGGDKKETLKSANYNKDIGLVIGGSTTSSNGKFSASNNKPSDYIACIDNNLNIEWVHHEERVLYQMENLIVDKGYIYVPAVSRKCFEKAMLSSTLPPPVCEVLEGEEPISTWHKINGEGKIVLKAEDSKVVFGSKFLAVLKDEKVIVDCSNFKEYYVAIYSESGEFVEKIELDSSPEEITATHDGGFIITSRNYKETLGAVVYPSDSSDVAEDRETVMTKYDSEGKLVWRKTWEDYPGTIGEELLYILQ